MPFFSSVLCFPSILSWPPLFFIVSYMFTSTTYLPVLFFLLFASFFGTSPETASTTVQPFSADMYVHIHIHTYSVRRTDCILLCDNYLCVLLSTPSIQPAHTCVSLHSSACFTCSRLPLPSLSSYRPIFSFMNTS